MEQSSRVLCPRNFGTEKGKGADSAPHASTGSEGAAFRSSTEVVRIAVAALAQFEDETFELLMEIVVIEGTQSGK